MRRVKAVLGVAMAGVLGVIAVLAINLGILRAEGDPTGPGHLGSTPATAVATPAPPGVRSQAPSPRPSGGASVPVRARHEFGEANDD